MPPSLDLILARVELVKWVARLGAVTAEALSRRDGCSVEVARGRLRGAGRVGLLSSSSPLQGRPALYTATAAGLRAVELEHLEPGRVSAANAAHASVCAEVAARLEVAYPDQRVVGERWLRYEERKAGSALASAVLGTDADGSPALHRPDLVLWPRVASGEGSFPIAVEVELTVKAPRRLEDICRAWADCPCILVVFYVAAPDVESPLERAIEKANAGEWIVMLSLKRLREGDEE
jgi:hypothetical protein